MPRKTMQFTHEGRQLEVCASPNPEGWKVQVLENGRPAAGIVYSVAHETNIDAQLQKIPADLVDELMRLARTDIEQGRVKLL